MEIYNQEKVNHILRWKLKPPTANYFPHSILLSASGQNTDSLMRLLCIIFLTITMLNVANAAESNILIIKSGTASVYNKITTATEQRINHICKQKRSKCHKPSISIKSIHNNKLKSIAQNKKWDLIVTVGTKAANRLNSFNLHTPTLYSLIPSNSFPSINNSSHSRQKSAIYIDQPIRRQLQLIKSAMPGRKKVGVLLGKLSGVGKQHLKQIMLGMGLEPTIIKLAPNDMDNSLNIIFSKSNILLAMPDPTVYNKQTVLKVLLSSYRHRVPVVGYSAAFVKSGATTAVYSTPRNIGHHIGDEVAKYLANNYKKLSPPAFPRYFTVNTNKSVTNSLKLRVPSRKTIISRIKKAGQ
ncbi:MAG: hypothetical protein GY814_16100 [Gammaproteobacteria bacterium]|nr:hypothetical protein [Gammaproteobacteria bacterium]